MNLTYDHTHQCSPCDRGSPVTLGGSERSEALTSIYILYNAPSCFQCIHNNNYVHSKY